MVYFSPTKIVVAYLEIASQGHSLSYVMKEHHLMVNNKPNFGCFEEEPIRSSYFLLMSPCKGTLVWKLSI